MGASGGHVRHDRVLIGRDLAAQRFGRALHLPGIDREARQVLQQVAALDETDQRGGPADHPRHGRRQRRVDQPKRLVPRAGARPTGGAVVIRAFQHERAQHAVERLRASSGVAGRVAAGADAGRQGVVRDGGIEALFYGLGDQAQGGAAGGDLHGLEVEGRAHDGADQGRDFRRDVRAEGRAEPPFSAPSRAGTAATASSWASAQPSQARQ